MMGCVMAVVVTAGSVLITVAYFVYILFLKLLSVHLCILLFSLFDLSFVASPSVL